MTNTTTVPMKATSTPPNIPPCQHLTIPQVRAIERASKDAGAIPVKVWCRHGHVGEIAIWSHGEAVGSVFRNASGGLAVWLPRALRRAPDAAAAVRVILKGD